MPGLLLGPMLRYLSDTEATVWVETDAPCEVEILGHRSETFRIGSHHYALVAIRGLEPGRRYEYGVRLDGRLAWPEMPSSGPPSEIRTFHPDRHARVTFGSCRVSAPHVAPFALDRVVDRRGRGLDALTAYTRRLQSSERDAWPDVLLLLGDQVYGDDVPEGTRAFIRGRRDTTRPPGEGVADFEEYAHLYRESWSEPLIRWLLSTVSTSMMFDDHDVVDDWNISESWLADMRRKPWWEGRIRAAFMSYWVYQHLGNLSPDELERDELLRAIRATDDGERLLRQFALRADRESAGSRWAYCRDLGGSRLIVLDSRAARVLEGGTRKMIDDEEWDWVVANSRGDFDHLLIASSLPVLLAPGMHHLQTWNEAISAGAWGRVWARFGEWLRRAIDLEHWASFRGSFEQLVRLLRGIGAGELGRPPASIVVLSGDVHHGYLARVGFGAATGVRSAVYQVVCSPFRNALGPAERRAQRLGASSLGAFIGRSLARAARVPPPSIRWRTLEGLVFDNQIGTLELRGREAVVRLECAVPGRRGDGDEPALREIFERRLA